MTSLIMKDFQYHLQHEAFRNPVSQEKELNLAAGATSVLWTEKTVNDE